MDLAAIDRYKTGGLVDSLTIKEIDWQSYLTDKQTGNIEYPSAYADDAYEILENTDAHVGGKLPWSKTHDRIVFRPNEMTVWSGSNGTGKSLLTAQAVLNFIKQGSHALMWSPEMTAPSIVARLVRQGTGIALPTREYFGEVLEYLDGKLYLYVREHGVTCDEVVGLIRFAAAELGNGETLHIVIDSLMKVSGINPDDYGTQKEFLNRLANEARDLCTPQGAGVHIHLVAHARKPLNDNTFSDKASVKGSSEITDLADNVLVANRNRRKQKEVEQGGSEHEDEPDCYLSVVKQRHGTGWEGTIGLWFHDKSMAFISSPDGRYQSLIV